MPAQYPTTQCLPQRAKTYLLALNALAFTIYFAHMPLALYANAGHDDRWHIEQAWNLVHHNWMGPFSVMTLIKGPGYGFFLALNSWLGFPLPLAHGLFHLLCVNLFAWVAMRLTRSAGLQVALAAVLTWHPVFMNPRAIRDAIYSGQSLAVIALWTWLLTDTRRGWSRAALAATTGLMTAWFWLTREESVWLLPGLICLTLVCALVREARSWRVWAFGPVCALVACIVSTQAVAAMNYVHYKGWLTIDVKEKNYVEALSLLNNLQSKAPSHYVPVPLDVRESLYQVSPAFASLRSTFENSIDGWAFGALDRPPHRDYQSSIFMWVFRDAVAKQGHYASEATAAAFYGQLSKEIRQACKAGTLACYTPWLDYVPHVTREGAAVLVPSFGRALAESIKLDRVKAEREFSMGPTADVLEFLNFPRIWPSADDPKLPWRAPRLLRIKVFLKVVYPWLTLALLCTSAASLLAALRWGKLLPRSVLQLGAMALACWAALGTRCALLALMVASHMDVLDNSQYIAPCYYLMPCAAVLTTYMGIVAWAMSNQAKTSEQRFAHSDGAAANERRRAS